MRRVDLLNAVRIAGYHDDGSTGTRLLIESSLSMTVYLRTFREGQRMRAAGVRCLCRECEAARKDG